MRPCRSLSTHPTTSRRPLAATAALALALLTSACAGAPPPPASAAAEATGFPVEITSCGHTSTVEGPVRRAVTMNQGATEVALALGVEDRLVGTAYLDDAVPQRWAAAYDAVPVLSPEYPTREELLAVEPDLVYGAYASAFDAGAAGSRAELERAGTAAYLSPFGCEEQDLRPDASFEAVWDEVDSVAAAFGVPERAEALRAEQQQHLAELAAEEAGAGLDVLWYDSGDRSPYVGAGAGGPQLVLDAVGASNVFADQPGSWVEASWEEVVAADPDVVVLADASWSSAEEKIAYLEADPVLSTLRAVREQRFVTVAFSESTAGVRLVDGAVSVAAQLAGLDAS